jgi:hypothetical protein
VAAADVKVFVVAAARVSELSARDLLRPFCCDICKAHLIVALQISSSRSGWALLAYISKVRKRAFFALLLWILWELCPIFLIQISSNMAVVYKLILSIK